MAFGWLGTLRQGQWRALRSFILKERADVGKRLAYIEAEMERIGVIRVVFAKTTDPITGDQLVTEQRVGFTVTQGSNLAKLLQAYVAQGGNPFDVSLFLDPEGATYEVDGEVLSTQPYGGVVYPISGSYSVGTSYEGGNLVVKKYTPSRTGGKKDLQDGTVAGAVDLSRRWVDQTIQRRIHDLEARIIKQCDLREQLMQEVDLIVASVGGVTGDVPSLDQDFYDESQGIVKTLSSIDSAFYETDADGAPDFSTTNDAALESYPSLLLDIPDEEDNTAL
jgi:hypothetical protein